MSEVINVDNPWKSIPNLTKIRVDADSRLFECFWFVDSNSKYGFLIEIPEKIEESDVNFSLKGIDVSTSLDGAKSLFMLILESKDDWEIFLTLCNDLIQASNNLKNPKSFFVALKNRLKRWQNLLSNKGFKTMNNSIQMGLFSEMSFLIDHLIPKFGLNNSIAFWVGPESDKQDFLLENSIFEIKSHRTTKAANVSISSPEQLVSIKEPLFLVAYSLSTGDSGKNVLDLINFVETSFGPEDEISMENFQKKIDAYGYVPPSSKDALKNFIIDKESYYAVTDEFPRLPLDSIPEAISKLTFSINLNKCEAFRVDSLEKIL